MLTFPLASVRDVIARGRADAQANGGFRNPYYGLRPGKDEQPGLWLVGDHGVYLLSNGKLAGGQKPFVVYAEECNPATDDDWFEVKRRTFGVSISTDPAAGHHRRRFRFHNPQNLKEKAHVCVLDL
ncbi:DUF3085 domain-containing protein [Agrobacterium radiobacter]|uniref:DUF3085 domain-containing protein n=1 Tax=Agrobacterium radiobacter TaxID=362 RepID=UPI003F83072F